eukprot:295915_1
MLIYNHDHGHHYLYVVMFVFVRSYVLNSWLTNPFQNILQIRPLNRKQSVKWYIHHFRPNILSELGSMAYKQQLFEFIDNTNTLTNLIPILSSIPIAKIKNCIKQCINNLNSINIKK